MKWIWSIGNKINDGHKALAVLTLNNLSFDASLLLLHDAPSVFTTLCSNSWRVRRKWQLSSFFPLTKVCTSNMKIFSYAPHILCLTCVIRDGKQGDLQGAQRFVLFNMAHGQPTMGACHAVAWKAAESFILQLPVPFQEMFFFSWGDACMCTFESFSGTETDLGHRKYPLSERGWMELSEGSEWWKKTSSLMSFVTFSLSFLSCYFAHGVDRSHAPVGNISTEYSVSDCHVDEPFSRMDGGLKTLPSERHGWILVETSAHLCCYLKTAQAHLVTGERGRCSADRMMYHLVRLNDNFISHPHFSREISPAHFSPRQLWIEPNVSQSNWRVSFVTETLTSSPSADLLSDSTRQESCIRL